MEKLVPKKRRLLGAVISLVSNATDTKTRDISVEKVFEAIRTGGEKLKGQIQQIQNRFEAELAITGDRKAAKLAVDALKKQLPAVMWSGTFSQRANNALIQHIGLLVADIDSLGERLPEVRKKLQESPYVIALFVSPTGDGLKPILRVPADAQKHAGSFRAVEKHVRSLTGIQIDQACKDLARLCFMSYDPEIYINEGAVEIEPLLVKLKPLKPVQPNGELPPDLSLRERIAHESLGALIWSPEKGGHFCDCPGKELHTSLTARSHTIVYLERVPTIKCQHNSCASIVETSNHELRSLIAKAERHANPPRVEADAGVPHVQPGEQKKLYPLSDVEMLPIKFVDKPLFQADAFHLLVGKKNAGKGTFLSSVAARVTHGELGNKKNVIWIAAGEDSLALDVRPRIEAAGGDVSKVYYPEFIPKLPTEVKLLQKWAEELGDVGLIVLDPISGMIPGKCDSHRDSDVRPVISPLNDLADQLQCLVVGVRHLRKDASGGALESVLGSIDWVNVPRAVIAVVYDKVDDIRYVQVVAGNRAPMGSESRGFRVVGEDVVPDGEPVAKAVFIDGPGKDVDDLLNEDPPKDNSSKTRQAAIRILDILENTNGEDLKQDDVFTTVAQELSISPKTVRQKAYFGDGMLFDLRLVKSYKEAGKLTGAWFFKRSDLPRPPEFL